MSRFSLPQLHCMLAAALLAMPLAGCDGSKEGTTITFDAKNSDGNVSATADGKSGEISVKSPILSGSITLPKMQLNASNFDMNGVHLFPGSTITGMSIFDDDKGAADASKVRVAFDSPASPDAVRDWFADRLAKAGFTLQADGEGLSGKTNEGKPFRLEMKPAGANKSQGVITIS